MFDLDAGKLLIVGVMALIFIPPKDLPRVLRQVGQFVGRMRRMAADFQGQFMEAMREADTDDLRREAQKLAEAARVDLGFDALKDLDRQMVAKSSVSKSAVAPVVTSPAARGEEFETVRPVESEHIDHSAPEQPAPEQPAPEPAATVTDQTIHHDGAGDEKIAARTSA